MEKDLVRQEQGNANGFLFVTRGPTPPLPVFFSRTFPPLPRTKFTMLSCLVISKVSRSHRPGCVDSAVDALWPECRAQFSVARRPEIPPGTSPLLSLPLILVNLTSISAAFVPLPAFLTRAPAFLASLKCL